jgi:hypothetical protein
VRVSWLCHAIFVGWNRKLHGMSICLRHVGRLLSWLINSSVV